MIRKYQLNLQSGRKLRRTLLLGNFQEKKKINRVIKKNLHVNPTIRKHRVFKPYDWEVTELLVWILVLVKGDHQIDI
jgi:hypothetical protein